MDLDDMLFFKGDDDSQAREEEEEEESHKTVKHNPELCKKNVSLLKRKMIKSDLLIRQYNDKIKECDLLNQELSAAKTEKQDVLNKYHITMEKLTRMELECMDYKQSIDRYKSLSEAQKLKLEENDKLLTQYNFKTKILDKEKTSLEENLKTLQENLKAKENEKKPNKHKSSQTLKIEKRDFTVNTNFASLEPEKCDVSLNTDFASLVSEKPLMQDKIIMTDEVLRTEPFPIFCTKCEKLIDPAPIDQILKIMSSPPPIIERIIPPNLPERKPQISTKLHTEDCFVQAHIYNNKSKHPSIPIVQVPQEMDKSSIMELARRVEKLENLINEKKIKSKKSNHSHNQCCTSRDVNLVIKVPPETDVHEYRKHKKRKLKKVKRLKNKPFKINKPNKIDKHQYLANNKWVVEHCTESTNENTIIITKEKKVKKQNRVNRKKEIDLLFESPERSISEEKNNVPSPSRKNSSPRHSTPSPSERSLSPSQKSLSRHNTPSPSQESVSSTHNTPLSQKSLSSSLNVSKTSKLGIKKSLFVENVNIEKSVEESDADLSLSCSSLSSQVSVSESNKIIKKDAKNSFSNEKLLIMPAKIQNNEGNRQRLLPSEIKMQENVLHISNESVNNNEDICREKLNVNNLNEEKEDNIRIKESKHYSERNYNTRKEDKVIETFISSSKSEENNLLQSPKPSEYIQKNDEIVITSCKKRLNLDTILQLNDENLIGSNLLEETQKNQVIDQDKQNENMHEKDFEEHVSNDEQITEQCSIQVSDGKNLDHNLSEIKNDNKLHLLRKDATLPNESLMNKFIEDPVTSLPIESLMSQLVNNPENSKPVKDKSIANENWSIQLVENKEENRFTKDTGLRNESSSNELISAFENSAVTEDSNLSNKILTNQFVKNTEKSIFSESASLPKENLLNELVENPEDKAEDSILPNKNLMRQIHDSPKKYSVTKGEMLSNGSLENQYVESQENILLESPKEKAMFERETSLSNENSTNDFIEISENCGKTVDLINNEVSECISPQSESDLYQSFTCLDKTTPFNESVESETTITHQDLLAMLSKNSDEESLHNECALPESTANMPLKEKQVDAEPKKTDESYIVSQKSQNLISKTGVTDSSSIKQVEKDDTDASQESKLEDNISVSNQNFQNSYTLPIMPCVKNCKRLGAISPKKSIFDCSDKDNCTSPLISNIAIRQIDAVNESSNSSWISTDTNYFSELGIKRGKIGKVRNVIVSDESSMESNRLASPETVKDMITNIKEAGDDKKSLTKLNLTYLNLFLPETPPIIDEAQISCNLQEIGSTSSANVKTSDFVEPDLASVYVPPKKRRIAHTPKTIEPSPSKESKQETLKITKSRKPTKNIKAKPGDKISEILEDYDKTCKERQQIFEKLKPPQPPDVSFRALLTKTALKSDLTQDSSKSPENMSIEPPLKKPRGRPPKSIAKKLAIDIVSKTLEVEKDNTIPPTLQRRIRRPPRKLSSSSENSENLVDLNASTIDPRVEAKLSDAQIQPVSRGRTSKKTANRLSDISKNLEMSVDLDTRKSKLKKEEDEEEEEEGESLHNSTTNASLKEGESNPNDVKKTNAEDEIQLTESKKPGRKRKVSIFNEDVQSPMKELRSRQVDTKVNNTPQPIPRGRHPKKTAKKLSNVSKNSEQSSGLDISVKLEAMEKEDEISDIVLPLDSSIMNASFKEEDLDPSIVEKSSIQDEIQHTESKKSGRKKRVLNYSIGNQSPMRELRSHQVVSNEEARELPNVETELNNTIRALPRGRTKKAARKFSNVNTNLENFIDLDISIKSEVGEGENEEDEVSDVVLPLNSSITNAPLEEGELDQSDVEKSSIQEKIPNTRTTKCIFKRGVPRMMDRKPDLNDSNAFTEQVDDTNCNLPDSTIRSLFNKYLITKKIPNKTRRTKIQIKSFKQYESICYEQFDVLIHTEDWTIQLNTQVMEELLNSVEDLRSIAMNLVEYATDTCPQNEPLDKSNTPPAPIMPRSEQKLVTLISTITQIHMEFSEMVEKGLEFKLFRLGAAKNVQIVERLFRILVVLNKIKKDREKVRMFCCDALYCLGLRAMNIIYLVLTCWPEVFPKHDSNNDIIVKTIVHIIMTLEVSEPYRKLNALRMLLSNYYEYPNSGLVTNDFRIELLRNLQENAPGVNTAVLLLCKKLGPNWAFKNVILELKSMIVNQSHPSLYEAVCLLGNLLRSFPARDLHKRVGKIIDELCDVLDDNAGSDDLQEGIVSCLLSISKFRYEQVARSVIKWQFSKELRSTTKTKLSSFFNEHDSNWWWNFVQTNFPLPLEE